MNLSAQSDKTNNNKANPWLRPTETLFTGTDFISWGFVLNEIFHLKQDVNALQ